VRKPRKMTKMSCQFSAGIPMPLSESVNTHSWSFFSASIWITGGFGR
jgi:hypothetical protein